MLSTNKNSSVEIFIKYSISVLCIVLFLFSCKPKTPDESSSRNEALPEQQNIVEVMVLEKGGFTLEMVSNGKLAAVQKAQLWFKNSGIIETITARNGETVAKGTVLARLQKT
jgi:multidrug efflux pump subunit AcrA (membrane-fusion protein)